MEHSSEDERPPAAAPPDAEPPPAVLELLERHLPGLRAFVRLKAGALVRAREPESDIVQSTCREVLERVHEFRHGGEAGFRQWLYTTALRKILDKHEYHTAQKRDVRREERGVQAGEADASLLAVYHRFASPSRGAVAQEELERIERAFAALPEDYREAVLLSRIVGLPRGEVARAMERSEASVRNLLHRALVRLSALLSEPGPAGEEGRDERGRHGR